jgi:CheY-like chemotaxis protein
MVIGASILIVEDDDDVLESLRELLEEAGYQVTAARNGVEALEELRQMAPPAAMLVDSLMPEMSGIEFLRTCAADPKLATIPALVISGYTHGAPQIANVHAFVAKPFNVEHLLASIARLLMPDSR